MIGRRKVLITGGMGYVGGRVAVALARRKDVDLYLGSREGSGGNPTWLPSGHHVAMKWDSLDNLASACDGVETVVHLAAMNEVDCAQRPAAALEVNGVNSVRLLEAAKARGVARFIYLSTAHVYGAPLVGRIDENTVPRPRQAYATSHRAAEDAVLATHDDGRLIGLVLRLSNAFGVPTHANVNRWTLLVNDLCRQAVKNHSLVLRSAGLQRRDFVTLHDVGRALSHALDLSKEQVGVGIFNVGGSWAPRIIDMVEIIRERCTVVLGYTPEIVRPDPTAAEIECVLDYRIDKLLATGFVLKGNPVDEIDATLRMCQKINNEPQ